ncbi:hypothetical protein [uncultured Erythrobacter sp.]|uniref:hypothetical protein n=1 Tax=uncultured Erythrobacter sp. TaxID=263913 RepID=UPI0026361DEA|nr:hypothetical protein [uncultured Erythrobacter sp.]
MIKRCLALSGAVLVAGLPGAPAWAQYAKEGRACVDNLCLGDGIEALEGVQWDTAIKPGSERNPEPSKSRSLGRGETNRTNNRYRGSFAGIIGYLADGRFDNGALAGMKGVTAACETQTMQGTFTSGGGNPTTVLVSMTAEPGNPNAHRWVIRRISRKVPNAVGAAGDAAKKQLEERYRAFTSRYRAQGGDMLQVNSFSGFQYTLSAPSVPNEAALLKQNTACGGAGGGPVSID